VVHRPLVVVTSRPLPPEGDRHAYKRQGIAGSSTLGIKANPRF